MRGHAVMGEHVPLWGPRVAEGLLPTFTTWGKPVRKCKTQLHRKGFRPRALGLVKSLAGTMVLKVEAVPTAMI